jgi:hypothetical protein
MLRFLYLICQLEVKPLEDRCHGGCRTPRESSLVEIVRTRRLPWQAVLTSILYFFT